MGERSQAGLMPEPPATSRCACCLWLVRGSPESQEVLLLCPACIGPFGAQGVSQQDYRKEGKWSKTCSSHQRHQDLTVLRSVSAPSVRRPHSPEGNRTFSAPPSGLAPTCR